MERWTPTNIIRLVALVLAFGGFYWGAMLVDSTLASVGSVDIKSVVFEGRLQSGSAGVFVCFFALAIIAAILVPLARREPTDAESATRSSSRLRRLYPLMWALVGAVLLSASQGWFAVTGFLLAPLSMLAFTMVNIARDER